MAMAMAAVPSPTTLHFETITDSPNPHLNQLKGHQRLTIPLPIQAPHLHTLRLPLPGQQTMAQRSPDRLFQQQRLRPHTAQPDLQLHQPLR